VNMRLDGNLLRNLAMGEAERQIEEWDRARMSQ
jgi:hypothetical protein